MAPKSATDPGGPLASAIDTLEKLGLAAEVSEIQRLLVERIQWREECQLCREELRLTRLHLTPTERGKA